MPNQASAASQVVRSYPASPTMAFGDIAHIFCDPAVGEPTYVVQLSFPAMLPSISLSEGVFFASRFATGWRVWDQYH